jgi:hypothetical protein
MLLYTDWVSSSIKNALFFSWGYFSGAVITGGVSFLVA